MSSLFALLFFVSFLALILGVIKPSLVKQESRGEVIKKIGIAMFVFFILTGITATDQSSTNQAKSETSSQTSTQQSTNKPKPISDIEYQSIKNKMEKVTEARFNKYKEGLIGKKVKWGGYVEEVNEKAFGGYEVWVDKEGPNVSFSVQDITFDVPESTALNLKKDQFIEFVGEISAVQNVMETCQISLKNAEVKN